MSSKEKRPLKEEGENCLELYLSVAIFLEKFIICIFRKRMVQNSSVTLFSILENYIDTCMASWIAADAIQTQRHAGNS